jgi:hypothetical protein
MHVTISMVAHKLELEESVYKCIHNLNFARCNFLFNIFKLSGNFEVFPTTIRWYLMLLSFLASISSESACAHLPKDVVQENRRRKSGKAGDDAEISLVRTRNLNCQTFARSIIIHAQYLCL